MPNSTMGMRTGKIKLERSPASEIREALGITAADMRLARVALLEAKIAGFEKPHKESAAATKRAARSASDQR